MIRGVLRWVLAAFYAAAGYLHLVRPEPFLGPSEALLCLVEGFFCFLKLILKIFS